MELSYRDNDNDHAILTTWNRPNGSGVEAVSPPPTTTRTTDSPAGVGTNT